MEMYISYHPLSMCSLSSSVLSHDIYSIVPISIHQQQQQQRPSEALLLVDGKGLVLSCLLSSLPMLSFTFFVLLYAFEILFSSSKSAKSVKFISFCLCCINHYPLISSLLRPIFCSLAPHSSSSTAITFAFCLCCSSFSQILI